MRPAAALFAVVCAWACAGQAIEAQTPDSAPDAARTLRIPRISAKPKLQSFIDDKAPAEMVKVDGFRQRRPGDGTPVSMKTTAWIGYDQNNLYAAFVCDADPQTLRARLGKREDIFNDDIVGLFLDTYQDHQHSYEFFVNPLGIQADAVATDQRGDDISFDTLWDSDGKLTPNGFAVLMTIPFKSLRFPPAPTQTWGIGFGRFIKANNENSFWPYITDRISGFTAQLGTATGIEHISAARNAQLIPYGAIGHDHYLDQPTNGAPSFQTDDDHRAGLEAKAVVHDSLTFDIALNPDFSQVESDDPQVTVNQRYAVQFPEKREFFIENSAYFATPENLFFSRNIINPEYGFRLTGSLGRWNIGVLAIDDRDPGIEAGAGNYGYERRTLIGAVRLQRNFSARSNAGVLLTDRAFAGYFNRVAAADAHLQLNSVWNLNLQAMVSQTRIDTVTHSGGDAWYANLRGQHRSYFTNLQYIDRSEGFGSDLGFIPRVNLRRVQDFSNLRFHPTSKWLVSWGPTIFTAGDFDHHNVQQDWEVRPGIQFELPRTTFIDANHGELFERFDGINFRRSDNAFGAHTEFFRSLVFDMNYNHGTRIAYDSPTNVNPWRGEGTEFHAVTTVYRGRHLKLDEIYYYTVLRTLPDSFGLPVPGVARRTAFVNHLIRSRATYQLSRQLSLRMIIDYLAVLQNPDLISFNRQKQVTGNVLLTYLVHPGTAFYIGYTDSLENLGLVDGTPATTTPLGFPSTTVQRQFFAKLSYLYRF